MPVGGLRGRTRYLVCDYCGSTGPEAPSSLLARQRGQAAGWTRRYAGDGELFCCPPCRGR